MTHLLLLSLLAQQIPQIDAVIEAAVAKGELPGAVCLVGQKDRILHKKAYGKRMVEPKVEAMTLDTIFDAASLTKVVVTTSSVLKLIEEGKVRLADRVTVHLPEFQGGKSEITVRHLLTHYSGLRPDVDLEPAWSGYETGIQKALVDKPTSEPGTRFVYSDINFILLGEIVRRVGGKPLNEYARDEIFTPLGMIDSGFVPDPKLLPRIAPTQKLHGVVHDPTTRFMGGVAGHAGLFTTADDLTKFARMILRKGAPLLSPATIAMATKPQPPAGLRGLGWDIDSPFAGNRGDLYPVGSFGHTGFTGTSLWIDPTSESFVILLANAVHPNGRPPITPLRGRVATVAAAYISKMGQVMTGLDVQIEEKFPALRAKKIGLITNHTGLARDGRRNIDAMVAAGVELKALYSPEHGILGKEDHENVGDTRDPASKLPVYSLYSGEKREPNPVTLKGIETLVFDIQDIGARFYTYGCTMKNAMEVAAKLDLEFVVLDRPNPITGLKVEGPVIDTAEMSFIGCLPIPVRHGMTLGELARYANDLMPKKAKLTVVPVRNWKRSMWFDETGLKWVNPSPNMKSLAGATLYPGLALIEFAKNYSVGRGTPNPFEHVSADWLDGVKVADRLNAMGLPGVKAYGKGNDVQFELTDRNRFDSTLLGVALIQTLGELYPKKIDLLGNRKLIGSLETIRVLDAGEAATKVMDSWMKTLNQFSEKRQQYLLYP
ncbi:MAG: DUF1343 domain-containing protein [Acidobacteria bacterium]|nr:DUF1343 domain-containing protein [Acidobacteriota bacterium]